MRCHYEVLEVERDADDEAIKKAYRRLALQWHPDKNPQRLDEATQRFAQIQQAYEVLGDAHERAWYDRHRENILKGGIDEHFEDNSLNLFSYFSSSCYSTFDDSEKGFYTIYRGVFETIASEDYEYLDDPATKYPSFGESSSDYDTVVGPFYGFWQSFSTARSFAWLDKYDIRDAPNRQVVRAMEKENRKLRDAGRRKRSEQIRELAAYVRKRDKRVKARVVALQEKREEQERKTEENRQRRIREQLLQIGEYNESEETRRGHLEDLREIEETLNAEFGIDDVDDEEQPAEDESPSLYCVACEKSFKTEKALSNHEKSKKHKETLAELKRHMQDEDAALLFEREGSADEGTRADARDASPSGPTGKKSKKQKKKERKKMDFDEALNENVSGDEAESSVANGLPDDVGDLEMGSRSNEDDANIFLKAAKEAGKTTKKESKKTTRSAEGVGNKRNNMGSAGGPRAGVCDRCGEVFDSRTKLFGHLKETGHATLKASQPVAMPQGPRARKPKKNS